MAIVFILIYLISFAIHLLLEYKESEAHIHDIGDLIDRIEFFMWCPVLNTLMLLSIVIGIFVVGLWELLKLDVLWEKFRNIRLK